MITARGRMKVVMLLVLVFRAAEVRGQVQHFGHRSLAANIVVPQSRTFAADRTRAVETMNKAARAAGSAAVAVRWGNTAGKRRGQNAGGYVVGA